jgi:Tol biopolymer transport system component
MGTDLRPLTDQVEVEGTGSWSPDGKWIVIGGSDANGSGLFKIPVGGGAPVRLASGIALNPVWSPKGDLIVYNSQSVSLNSPLRAMRPDGTAVAMPELLVRVQGERFRFLPDGKALVYMQGASPSQDFWLLDIATGRTRQLTRLNGSAVMRTFDITSDGKQIIFDRQRENSDIVLIDLPRQDR